MPILPIDFYDNTMTVSLGPDQVPETVKVDFPEPVNLEALNYMKAMNSTVSPYSNAGQVMSNSFNTSSWLYNAVSQAVTQNNELGQTVTLYQMNDDIPNAKSKVEQAQENLLDKQIELLEQLANGEEDTGLTELEVLSAEEKVEDCKVTQHWTQFLSQAGGNGWLGRWLDGTNQAKNWSRNTWMDDFSYYQEYVQDFLDETDPGTSEENEEN